MKIAVYIMAGLLAVSAACCAGKKKKGTAVTPEPARTAVWDDESRDQCLRAIRRARTDARNGYYRMYVFGPDRYDEKFARFLGEYLKTRHGIDLVVFGSGNRERSKCYSNEMDKIILNTFGPDVLAGAEQEARELFNSRK
ncbi:MAG TPA: hypothetical protein PLM53_10510 [Spirochaetota bacterium]|nr:hypothetical protein [Spirochaetota bacterium]HPC39283.1 hypothetical protein [Spirochaetota bacterium]HPL16826.1 hypothetical protein [Spirochaetota bacterium]HQF08779.1 hypothetical protein [Spirochaetota bacterium]HQH97520.1 hypothetical protein [Spirochaetota bacterium]